MQDQFRKMPYRILCKFKGLMKFEGVILRERCYEKVTWTEKISKHLKIKVKNAVTLQ
jgi:hypothetical protein